jgi:tetraprenyl-beta-curcumene synthase
VKILSEMSESLRDASALCSTIARYWLTIRPRANRELKSLRYRVQRIPDPILRRQASFVLSEESWTIEGAAFFATLVPPEHLSTAVRLMVGVQALYTYIDGLGEEPSPDRFRDSTQLQLALMDVLDPSASSTPYYLHHGRDNDGGFLDDLIADCQESFRALPSTPAVMPGARRMAARYRECQSHTHAAIGGGFEGLKAWSLEQEVEGPYAWQEVAAGANNTISIHALFAAAGDPRTTPEEAKQIEDVYFAVCALASLLDSLIDYRRDLSTGNFSSIAGYETNRAAAERLGALACKADDGVRSLHHGRRHAAILCSIVAAYLSAPEARSGYALPVTTHIIESLGPMASIALPLMRLRRRVGSGLADAGVRHGPHDPGKPSRPISGPKAWTSD